MAAAVTKEEIQRINELYRELGSYAAVARAVGRTAGTVKKYVIPEYVSQEEVTIIPFDESSICDVPDLSAYTDNLGILCEIRPEERENYEALHSEINI